MVLFLFLLSLQGMAQVDLSLSKEFEPESDSEFNRFIGANENHFYVYRIKTRGKGTRYFVEKYENNSFKKLWERDLKLEEMSYVDLDPKHTTTHTLLSEDNVYIMFPVTIEDKKILALKRVQENGTVVSGYETLASSDKSVEFQFRKSNDESKFLIVTKESIPKEPSIVNVGIYNSDDRSVKWSAQLPRANEKSGIETFDYAVSNIGELAFSYIYMEDFETEHIGAAIAVTSEDGEDMSTATFDMSADKILNSPLLKFTENNKLVSIGLFRDEEMDKKSDKTRNAGLYYILLDLENDALVSKGMKYFSPEVTKQLTYKGAEGSYKSMFGKGREQEPGDWYYGSNRLIESKGNYYYITEHAYNVSSSYSVKKVRKELIVAKMDGESGQIDWTELLQKNSMDRTGLYNFMQNNGNLYVFCLEHPKVEDYYRKGKNYEPGQFPDIHGERNCNLRVYKVTPQGDVHKNIIYQNKDFSYIPQYENVSLQNDNDLLIYLRYYGKEKFGKLNVKY